MNFITTIKLALKSIVSNKMRTFLTMLGIIIGVSAVIILVSVAEGTTQQVTESIESMGTNLISVTINGRGINTTVSYDEVLELSDKPGISSIAPVVSGQVTAKYGTDSMNITIGGVDENYQVVQDHKADIGRFITPLLK